MKRHKGVLHGSTVSTGKFLLQQHYSKRPGQPRIVYFWLGSRRSNTEKKACWGTIVLPLGWRQETVLPGFRTTIFYPTISAISHHILILSARASLRFLFSSVKVDASRARCLQNNQHGAWYAALLVIIRLQLLNSSQAYSPAPESGIRSTLQPDSPIYQTTAGYEEEPSQSNSPLAPPAPPAPPRSFPVQGNGIDTTTPSGPQPFSPLQSVEPRIYLRLPPLDTARKGKLGKHTPNSRKRVSTSTTPSAISSRQNSQNRDSLNVGTSMFQGFIVNEQGVKKFPCPQCDKQFGRIHDRKRHMEESTSCRGGFGNSVEIEAPMWVCERCGYSFSRRDSMNRHLKNPDACKAHKNR